METVKKALTPEEELDLLYRRSMLTCEYLRSYAGLEPASAFIDAVERTFQSRNLRGMRIMVRELSDLAKDLPPHRKEELQAELKFRFGIDGEDEDRRERDKVAAVLARGRINSEREYRRVMEWIEELESEAVVSDELRQLRDLASNYGGSK